MTTEPALNLPSQPLGALDPAFEEIALETGSFTYALPGTSVREKLLQCLANDVCRGHLGLAMRLHVQAALDQGVPFGTLLAVIRFIAPYAGYPAAADALAALGQVRTDLNIEQDESAAGGDCDIGRPEGGREDRTITTDEWLAAFVGSRTGQAWRESALTRRERAFLALTADVANDALGGSFRRHVELARQAGASIDDICDALRFTAEFGAAKTAAALAALDGLCAEGFV